VVIEPTEALTVVDVNSGSFTRSATSRETVLWTNCEAATEIARQLKLRNIAGVIIVDFIDMDARRDQLQVLEHFSKALKPDKSRPQIAQLTELGLVELTRKRQGQSIYEIFGKTCPTCDGLGLLTNLPGHRHDHSDPVPTFAPTAEDFEDLEGDDYSPSTAPSADFEDDENGDLDLSSHPVFRNNDRRRPNTPQAKVPIGNGGPANANRNNRRNRGRGRGRDDLPPRTLEPIEALTAPVPLPEEPLPVVSVQAPVVEDLEPSVDHIPPVEQEVLAYMGLPADLLRREVIPTGDSDILVVRPPIPESLEELLEPEESSDPRRRKRRRVAKSTTPPEEVAGEAIDIDE